MQDLKKYSLYNTVEFMQDKHPDMQVEQVF